MPTVLSFLFAVGFASAPVAALPAAGARPFQSLTSALSVLAEKTLLRPLTEEETDRLGEAVQMRANMVSITDPRVNEIYICFNGKFGLMPAEVQGRKCWIPGQSRPLGVVFNASDDMGLIAPGDVRFDAGAGLDLSILIHRRYNPESGELGGRYERNPANASAARMPYSVQIGHFIKSNNNDAITILAWQPGATIEASVSTITVFAH